MRIKRVEIIGFKSFCDRAVVNIGEQITGVVGPNGCGKSNIVDAIRWCMGEQSAKHLRGKAMEDVIFAGSETRGPSPMAEVSITFDDVGFSHEALEVAMTSETAEAERALEQITPEIDAADAADAADAVDAASDAEAVEAVQAVDATAEAPAPAPVSGEASSEVAEFLANADAPPKLDFARYTEVTITRRLYRDGSSHYLINKTPCRLRDVTDFFLGTGVGTKAYAIIEQGRIGQIVSARPQDRRAIIEEAAGITKFKSKKKAAERKLEQTKQNLLRVSDIVVELDKRMGTLRRQAQKAERYRKYRAELRDLELWKAAHKFLELGGLEKLAADRLVVAAAELGDLRAAETTKDAAAVAERAELSIEERRLAGLSEQIYELDNRVRLAESKIEFQGREAAELDERALAAAAEAAELTARRDEAAARLAIEEQELAVLEADVAREAADVQTREAAVGEARQQLVNAQARLDEARAQLASARTEVATCEAKRESLARRRDEAERRHARVVEDVTTIAERAKDVEREARRVDGALAEMRQTRLDLGAQEQGFEARRELLAEQVHEGDAQVETLRTEAHRRRSRLQSLIEIQERYEGFARGTRAVMQKSDGDARIRGLVADVVRAPETLEIAVEAALGDRLGGVLVDDPAVGVEAIGFLKSSGAGRSAFVPLSSSRAASGGIEVDDRTALTAAHAAIGGDGVLGRMTELVEFADGYGQVGQALLRDYVVVDSIERAIALHAAGAPETLVTLDGDLVDAAGVVAGGSRDAQGAGVLSQKREIRELEEIVEVLERDLTEATARLVTARQELKQVEKAIAGLKAQAHESDLALMGHDKDASRLHAEHDRLRARMDELGRDRIELDERLAAVTAEETEVGARRAAAEDRIDHFEKEQLGLIEGVTGGRERVDELGSALTEARVRAAQLGEKRASLEASALRLMQTESELAARIARLGDERTAGTDRAARLRADSAELAADLGAVRDDRHARGVLLETGRAAYEQRLMALTAIELEVRDLRSRADKLAHEVTQLEISLDHCRTQRAVVCDAMMERYQVEVAKILHDYHLRAPSGAVEDERAAELRDLIERMGTDINLTAIEEFQEVSTRFEFLSTQRADLEHAVDQLEKAIDKINKTSRRLFKDTFHAVNAKFKEVYPRLFRGGQASLSLSAPPGGGEADVLEAGVEIMAQPPGKKNTTIEQLSGGEKALTAVALVFSIFLIKPSPFCILDEVDAPLDEANVDRYNEIVREMTDRSQFIVITHNKRTMESADNLYGVTMQEPGVSKLVAVNLKKLGEGRSVA